MKKAHVAVLAGIMLAGALFLLYPQTPSSENDIPWIDVGVEPSPGQEPPPATANVITGQLRTDLSLVYKDGTRDTYTSSFKLPDIALGSLFGSNNKEIDSIEVVEFAKFDVPENNGHTLGNSMFNEHIVSVYAGNNLIVKKDFSGMRHVSLLGAEYETFKLTVPANAFAIASGDYDISIKTADKFRIAVDGEDRLIEAETTPTVGMSGLQPVKVVTYKPAVASSLDKEPLGRYVSCLKDGVPNSQCFDLTSYKWTIIVKATGFKSNASVGFTYDEHSYREAISNSPVYPTATKYVQSDGAGTAIDKTEYGGQYSTPKCTRYGANLTVSDGVNEIKTVIGCLYH